MPVELLGGGPSEGNNNCQDLSSHPLAVYKSKLLEVRYSTPTRSPSNMCALLLK